MWWWMRRCGDGEKSAVSQQRRCDGEVSWDGVVEINFETKKPVGALVRLTLSILVGQSSIPVVGSVVSDL